MGNSTNDDFSEITNPKFIFFITILGLLGIALALFCIVCTVKIIHHSLTHGRNLN
jgi:hypothetical protein